MVDILTITGLAAGAATVMYVMAKSGILHLLLDPLSFILVFGGTMSATLISYPWEVIKQVPGRLLMMFTGRRETEKARLGYVDRLSELAERARVQGVQGLEREAASTKDDFLAYGLRMVIDGVEAESVRENLESRIGNDFQRNQKVNNVFRTMATLAPIFGLLGTLIGVVVVLKNLSDPSNLGYGMAIAITTTFYGIFASNFLFLPASVKLNDYNEDEAMSRRIVMEGVLGIHHGEPPSVLRKRLSAFLAEGAGRK